MDICLYTRPGECPNCYRTIFATIPLRPKWAQTQAAERQRVSEAG